MRAILPVLFQAKEKSKKKKNHYNSGAFKILVKKKQTTNTSMKTLLHYLLSVFWLTPTQNMDSNVISNKD